MKRDELYHLVKVEQSNICQIVSYKDGKRVYSEC